MFGFGNKKKTRELEERLGVLESALGYWRKHAAEKEEIDAIIQKDLGYASTGRRAVEDKIRETHNLMDVVDGNKIWKKKGAQ